MWRRLRNRQLCGYKFRRQVPIAPYIVDFLCLDPPLIVELDGGQHLERTPEDDERTRFLQANGYRVIRFWNDDVLLRMEDVLAEILRQLELHLTPALSFMPLWVRQRERVRVRVVPHAA